MDAEFRYDPKQLAALRLAIERNPKKILSETGDFLTRGLREYNKYIIRSPWKIGGGEGGAPVKTGNLRDTHIRKVLPFEASIAPTARYAVFVHEGTKRMPARPWLEYAKNAAEGAIQTLAGKLLDNVTKDLAK